ncbi:hypothetical protein SISSUDRAFT_1038739 [Sistotremastrum suecicum HHB10207 ss-3]|uniref:Uncharacterized protein n=1 Tax=Sistotremastrum suecicum HHB10207 ss-3 TaxID=1314776 RepID=A0A165WE52_9AGAM|nr:hypothetical protein SISSUDRAFT_1038739 [Sistotremastrum suecicum HHB10207 ss-3]
MEEILEDQIRITVRIELSSHLLNSKDAVLTIFVSSAAKAELEDDAEAAELNVMMMGLGDSSSEISDQPSEEDWRAWGLWEDDNDEPSPDDEGDISYASDGPPDLQEMSDSSADSAEYSSGIDDLFWDNGDEEMLEDDSDEEIESRSYRATVEDYVSDDNESDRSEITVYESGSDSDDESSSEPMLAESYGVRLEI